MVVEEAGGDSPLVRMAAGGLVIAVGGADDSSKKNGAMAFGGEVTTACHLRHTSR